MQSNQTITEPERETKIYAETDVLVVGGGPAGARIAVVAGSARVFQDHVAPSRAVAGRTCLAQSRGAGERGPDAVARGITRGCGGAGIAVVARSTRVLEHRVAVDVREERTELRYARQDEGRAGVARVVPLRLGQLVADLVVAQPDDERVLRPDHAIAVELADLGIELAGNDCEARLVDPEGCHLRVEVLTQRLRDRVEGLEGLPAILRHPPLEREAGLDVGVVLPADLDRL